MEGWSKVVAGIAIGVAGTIYATNEELRKHLPRNARDLPESVRRRFESAVSAAREASVRRREEILRDLEAHGGGDHAARGVKPLPEEEPDPAATRSASEKTTPSAEVGAD